MAIFLFAIAAYSQNEDADSVNQAVTAPSTEEDYQDEDETITNYQDTLRQNFRSIVYDSIEAVNTDKGFYYKSYLDSLLRATAIKKTKPRRDINLSGGGFFNSVFGIIFWVAAIGLFGYLVYRLFLINSAVFSRNRKNLSSDI